MAPRKGYRSANDPNHEEYPVTWKYDRLVRQGDEYFKLGQYQQAIEEYDKAIKLNPNDAIGYKTRGNSYLALAQYQRAIEDYDKAIELDPNDAEARTLRQRALRALDESAK